MKKFIGSALAGVSCMVLLFAGCSAGTGEGGPIDQALLSALSPSTTTDGSSVVYITPEDAQALVEEKLDPEEEYTIEADSAPTLVDSREVYLVKISLDGSVLEPVAAVDAITGELLCRYEDNTLGNFVDLPYLSASARAKDWSGTFLREDGTASVELRQIDTQSCEFVLETNASGITSTLSGTILTTADGLPQYSGGDGLALTFELSVDAQTLIVRVPSSNTVSSADGYAGIYRYTE